MSATEVAAIIGAGAWIPQIYSWLHDYFATPRLKIFVPPAPEIGFNVYGTVLNLRCAVSASVNDAVIEHMEAELTHENGDRIVLPWRSIHETLAEIEMPTGEIERHRRFESALALKVIVEDLSEQTILFQDAAYQERAIAAANAVESRKSLLAKQNTRDRTALTRSDEMAELQHVIQTGLRWQEGKYDLTARARIAESKHPFEFRYAFSLTATDISLLKDNVSEVGELVMHTLHRQTQLRLSSGIGDIR